MDEVIHAHPPRETEPDCIVVWLLFKARSGARKAARLWLECFRNEVFMSAGWNGEALEPNAHHRAQDLNDNDDTSTCGHSDSFMVELRVDVVVGWYTHFVHTQAQETPQCLFFFLCSDVFQFT